MALTFDRDELFHEWLDELEDLELGEMAASYDEIAEDASFGSTPEARIETLESAHRLTRALNWLGLLVSIWAFWYPRPYEWLVAVLIAIPWVGALIAWRSAGLIRLDERKGDLRPSVALFVMLPEMILAARAVFDYETVGSLSSVLGAAIIGILLFFAKLVADPSLRANRASAVSILFFTLIYGYGAAIEINCLADATDMQQHRYKLLSKPISKGNAASYRVSLQKTDPKSPDVDRALVTPWFYERLNAGDSVCLAIRPGALGVKWYSAGPCPPYVR